MTTKKNILALDPAARTGFAHTNGQRGVWILGVERTAELHARIIAAADEWGVDLIATEDASFGSHNPNVQALHNELRGIIRFAAAQLGAKVVMYKPNTIKKYATGNGRAKKLQMMRACETILRIKPESDDVADALWILHMAQSGYVSPAEAERQLLKRVKKAKKAEPRLF